MNQADIDRIKDYCAGMKEGKFHCRHQFNEDGPFDLPAAMAEIERLNQAMTEVVDSEQTRWQEAIYHKLCKITSDIPDLNIDGKGCDSGDPLDFTLSEISQALSAIIDQRDHLKSQLEQAKAFRDIGRELEP